MGERPMVAIAEALKAGKKVSELTEIPQTAYVTKSLEQCSKKPVMLYSYEDCLKNKTLDAKNFRIIEEQSNVWDAEGLAQQFGNDYVVINEPDPTITTEELDAIY